MEKDGSSTIACHEPVACSLVACVEATTLAKKCRHATNCAVVCFILNVLRAPLLIDFDVVLHFHSSINCGILMAHAVMNLYHRMCCKHCFASWLMLWRIGHVFVCVFCFVWLFCGMRRGLTLPAKKLMGRWPCNVLSIYACSACMLAGRRNYSNMGYHIFRFAIICLRCGFGVLSFSCVPHLACGFVVGIFSGSCNSRVCICVLARVCDSHCYVMILLLDGSFLLAFDS